MYLSTNADGGFQSYQILSSLTKLQKCPKSWQRAEQMFTSVKTDRSVILVNFEEYIHSYVLQQRDSAQFCNDYVIDFWWLGNTGTL